MSWCPSLNIINLKALKYTDNVNNSRVFCVFFNLTRVLIGQYDSAYAFRRKQVPRKSRVSVLNVLVLHASVAERRDVKTSSE
jgi:hypothetical protein